MVAVKVWLGGEGPSELGTRHDRGDEPGVLETLLRKIEPNGWRVDGATLWRRIRKYRANVADREGANHEDIHHVMGLALVALEAGCEVLAFTRDADSDAGRADALRKGIAAARRDYPTVAIVGGLARPAIEGWIVALHGGSGTDAMSRGRTCEVLSEREIDEGRENFVAVVEAANLETLPNGCESLCEWITEARTHLGTTIRGSVPASASDNE